ncbi:MAG: hypothetical protein ACOZAR_01395 [Patescibacteria group bacterium]
MKKDYWDKYIDDLLIDLGADDWSKEERDKIRDQVAEAWQTQLMADITGKLNSSQKVTLKTMLSEDKTTLQIINFLYSIRPDIMKIVESSMIEFKKQLLS